jgi:hypothetical protein
MKKLWFRDKKYGWGWYPSSWQGWVVIVVGVGLIILNAKRLSIHNNGASFEFIVQTLLIVTISIAICYKHGEKPHWSWGDKK